MKKYWLFALLMLAISADTALALSKFQELTTVFNRTVGTVSGVVSRQAGAEQGPSGVLRIIEFGVPLAVQVEAIDQTPEGTLLVPDIATKVSGITVSPRDVLMISPSGSASIAFSGESMGLAPPAKIVAIEAYGGGILFTLDIASEVAGISVRPRDIAYFDGQETTIIASGDALEIAQPTKIVALESSVQGNLIFSVDAGAVAAEPGPNNGVLFLYDLNSGNIEQIEARAKTVGSCGTCDLVAVAGEFDEDVIFQSYFYSLELQ